MIHLCYKHEVGLCTLNTAWNPGSNKAILGIRADVWGKMKGHGREGKGQSGGYTQGWKISRLAFLLHAHLLTLMFFPCQI